MKLRCLGSSLYVKTGSSYCLRNNLCFPVSRPIPRHDGWVSLLAKMVWAERSAVNENGTVCVALDSPFEAKKTQLADVYQQFPFRNSSTFSHSDIPTFRQSYLFLFHTLANSFAPTKNSTHFFSSNSELFWKNTGVWRGCSGQSSDWCVFGKISVERNAGLKTRHYNREGEDGDTKSPLQGQRRRVGTMYRAPTERGEDVGGTF